MFSSLPLENLLVNDHAAVIKNCMPRFTPLLLSLVPENLDISMFSAIISLGLEGPRQYFLGHSRLTFLAFLLEIYRLAISSSQA